MADAAIRTHTTIATNYPIVRNVLGMTAVPANSRFETGIRNE